MPPMNAVHACLKTCSEILYFLILLMTLQPLIIFLVAFTMEIKNVELLSSLFAVSSAPRYLMDSVVLTYEPPNSIRSSGPNSLNITWVLSVLIFILFFLHQFTIFFIGSWRLAVTLDLSFPVAH